MVEVTILITPSAQDVTHFTVLITAPEATVWQCSHEVDWAGLDIEVEGLSRSLKRVVQRRREISALHGQAQFIFDVLLPAELKQL